MNTEFVGFGKIARLFRDCIITEKIDGTNAQVMVYEDGSIRAGSRTQWLDPVNGPDNAGFAKWVDANKEELITKLGVGQHFGEWWGKKIQRTYGLDERRFSLFNTSRWSDDAVRPSCCHVVPVLYSGIFSTDIVRCIVEDLWIRGSRAAPGFMKPEGVVTYHVASNQMFKTTLEHDEQHKFEVKK